MSSLEPTYPCLRAPSCPPGLSEGTVPAPVKLPSTASPGLEPGRPLTPQDTDRGTNGKGASQRTTPRSGDVTALPLNGVGGPSSEQPRPGSLSAAKTGSGPGPSGCTAPGPDHWTPPPTVCSSVPGCQQAGTGPALWNSAHGRHTLAARGPARRPCRPPAHMEPAHPPLPSTLSCSSR